MEHDEEIYQVIVAPAANDRMAEHFAFLTRVSPEAAERLLGGLAEDIQSLETLPHRNPPYERPFLPKGKYRYLLSCERYRIVYQIEDSHVYVDDIQDCRQDDSKRSTISFNS